MRILRARLLLLEAGALVQDGALLVRGGRVERVLAGPRALARARSRRVPCEDLDGVLAPGLVDAHAHLELGALAGRVGAGEGFTGWVRALVAARARTGEDALAAGARAGLARLAATGTTAVGDIDSTGAGEAAARAGALRVRLYRELLDADDPARTASALERVDRPWRAHPRVARGISPHAPFTVSDAAMRAAARTAARRRWPVTIHWSETEEEIAWMLEGAGPLAALLARSPRRAGLERLAAAGLLGPRTSLVHGNHPRPGEIERIAASGATLVHCPGSHRFFARARFPVERYLAAGVPLALGTDSLASNDDLDLRREMALFRAAHPGLAPEIAWRAATIGGARALGWEGEIGCLTPRHRADCALYRVRARTARSVLEALTSAQPDVLATWVAGKPVHAAVLGTSGGAGTSRES